MWHIVRSTDWSQTCLGPIEQWPNSLHATLRMVLASKQPICFWWGADLLQFHNESFLPFLGKRADGAFGAPFLTLWADVLADVEPYARKALKGEATWTQNLPLTMTRNGFDEETYWSFSYSPLFDDGGAVAGILNITTETTDAIVAQRAAKTRHETLVHELEEANGVIVAQREAEKLRRVVQREMSHRLKNTFAVVQAIISQSMRGDVPVAEARDAIRSRIQALSNAQDVLLNTLDHGIAIKDIVDTALLPHQTRSPQVMISGPAIKLASQQGMGLALALHELATNATKYGGLSSEEGRVEVRWSLDDGEFCFEWRETNGPAVSTPTRRGFGSRLLERIVPRYFNGTASFSFNQTGITYLLVGRLAHDEQATD